MKALYGRSLIQIQTIIDQMLTSPIEYRVVNGLIFLTAALPNPITIYISQMHQE